MKTEKTPSQAPRLISLFFIVISESIQAYDDNPYRKFDASKRFTDSTTINWVLVKSAADECQRESRKRGLGGFPYKVEACSFWSKTSLFGKDTCMIITDKMTNGTTVSHEVRHCFSGDYHK